MRRLGVLDDDVGLDVVESEGGAVNSGQRPLELVRVVAVHLGRDVRVAQEHQAALGGAGRRLQRVVRDGNGVAEGTGRVVAHIDLLSGIDGVERRAGVDLLAPRDGRDDPVDGDARRDVYDDARQDEVGRHGRQDDGGRHGAGEDETAGTPDKGGLPVGEGRGHLSYLFGQRVVVYLRRPDTQPHGAVVEPVRAGDRPLAQLVHGVLRGAAGWALGVEGYAPPAGFRKELLKGTHVGRLIGTLVSRKSIVEKVGMFNTTLSTAEDVDWFSRANDQQVTMALIPKVLMHKRVHCRNISQNVDENNRNLLKTLRKSVHRKKANILSNAKKLQ